MVGWVLMPPEGSGVRQCYECIMKKVQPLVDFNQRRKTKTLRIPPSWPILEIFTIAMNAVQLSVDFDPFLFVSPLLPPQM